MNPASVLGIENILQPLGGFAEPGFVMAPEPDGPDLTVRTVRIGDIGAILAPRAGLYTQLGGSGVGLDAADALPRALGEAVERYSASVFSEEQFVLASARELGAEALDLATVPRCSKNELAHPRCPLRAPDRHAGIRWVRGLSLSGGTLKYLPAVMVYLYAGHIGDAERFWLAISTGCAAHRSHPAALAAGICEVIERDALSVFWLQQLPLPRLEIDGLGGEAAVYWERLQRASATTQYWFFDATTDLGVPTILGLQISPFERRRTTLVSCACAPDPSTALIKVLREFVAHRVVTSQQRTLPRSPDDCTGLEQGAALMACAEQAGAFDFLLRSKARRRFSEMAGIENAGERDLPTRLLGIFERRGIEVFAADLSTDEALRCGLKVVRVVIPALQPFSYHYRARYLGHPRLYDAPRRMGYPVRPEAKVNPWPIPFA